MPTLDWIGKKAVINHDKEVPFHLLRCDDKLSVGDPESGNLLVQGDNLVALKALLTHYAGQVKCIYIDPPYNTGNENWTYNDAVNSPEMRDWLGKVVGHEAEDLSRHDKWLCMMYPRLCLLRQFLRDDGAIFVSIDDTEFYTLRAVMAEVFGEVNFLCTFIWQHSVQPKGYSGTVSVHHNYVVAFRRSQKFVFNDLKRREEHNVHYSNPDKDPRGPWRSGDVRNALYRPNLIYDLVTPSGKIIKPPPKGWRWSKATMYRKIEDGEIVFRSNEERIVRKIYLADQTGRPAESIFFAEDVGTTREANQELKNIFSGSVPFDTPKPVALIRRILQIGADPDSIVMDSFAGSGTTGHAVLEANKEDGGTRRFVLVELDEQICKTVTAPRLSKAVLGGSQTKANGGMLELPALSGGFRFVTLGEPLFDETGNIRADVRFADLAAHVFFVETGVPLPKRKNGRTPLLGAHNGVAIYLLFNGILGDKTPQGGNVLTRAVRDVLPPHDGPKVVYGTSCRIGPERLRRENITFRQIPYEVKVH